MIVPLELVDMPRSHRGPLRERGHDRIERYASHLSPSTRSQLHAVWDGMCDAEQMVGWDDIDEAMIVRAIERWRAGPTHHRQSTRPVRQLVECLPIECWLRDKYSSRHEKKPKTMHGSAADDGRQNKREEHIVGWSHASLPRTQQALIREQAAWALEYPGLFRARDLECYTHEMRTIAERWTAGLPLLVGGICGASLRRAFLAAATIHDGTVEIPIDALQSILADLASDAYDTGAHSLIPVEDPT